MDEALRQLVRQRAANRCEYCGLPAEYTDAPFQVDHIIAEKHHGPTVDGNLAWSCFYRHSAFRVENAFVSRKALAAGA